MIYIAIILWLLFGLIGAKWCLDCVYQDFKKIDDSDIVLCVFTMIIGPMGFIVGLLNKFADKIENYCKRPSKLTVLIQNYYKRNYNDKR